MKKLLLPAMLAILLLLTACGSRTQDAYSYYPEETPVPQETPIPPPQEAPPPLPPQPPPPPPVPVIHPPPVPEHPVESVICFTMAANLFAQANAAWDADNGALWGIPLHTPLVIACSLTRDAVATHPMGQYLARQTVGDKTVYAGTLPSGVWIGNTSVDAADKNWAMMTLRLMEIQDFDELRMLADLLHKAFHAVQPSIHNHTGMSGIQGGTSEISQIRYVLELAALMYAWNSSGEARLAAINDALYFRTARRAAFTITGENAGEIGEGLVQYTADLMLARNREQIAAEISTWVEILLNLDMNYTASRNHRWVYYSGAMYALLLDEFSTDWRTQPISRGTDLGKMLQEAAGITEITPPACLERYGYSQVTLRIRQSMADFNEAVLAALYAMSGPQIRIDVAPGYAREWDYNRFIIVPTHRYRDFFGDVTNDAPFLRRAGILTCEWGRLELEDGHLHWARQPGGRRYYSLSAPSFEMEDNRIYGPGWVLTLNEGWEIQPAAGNFILRMPRS